MVRRPGPLPATDVTSPTGLSYERPLFSELLYANLYNLTANFWQMEAKYYAQNQTRRGSISTAASPRPLTRPPSGVLQMHDSFTLTPVALPPVSPKAPSNVGGEGSPAFTQPAATPNAATKSHLDARMYKFTLFFPLQSSYPR